MNQRIQATCERQDYKVYRLGGLTYVPHYRNPNAFVRPGYPRWTSSTYTKDELLAAGAQEVTLALFPRGTVAQKEWND